MDPKITPEYKLQDLIDMAHFQNLQDRLNEIYSFPSAIIDNDGNILTATAWQDICTEFYRKNGTAEKECLKSDQYIINHLHEANPAVSYKCPHGLIDNATPIIVDGVHYGNFFTGQFFLEKPNMDFYKEQARKYGFDENAFLTAVSKVPIWTTEQLNSYLFFIKGLITIISESALKNLREIDARKRNEISEQRIAALIKTTKDGFWIASLEGRIIDTNESYCNMTGYSIDELLQMHISDIDMIDTPADIAARIQLLIINGTGLFETKHRRKDGSVFDVEVSVTYLAAESAQFICFCRDITSRKQAEEMLKESRNRLELALTSAKMGIWDWDIINNKMVWDDQMFYLYGISERPVSYGIEIWKSGLHPDDIQYAWDACQAAISGVKKYDVEFRVRHPSGEERIIKADGIVIRDSSGNAIRMLGINHDITERKVAEQSHRKYEQQLQQTQKLESLGLLAGGIAHDFNNLMGGIYGYIETASEETKEVKVTSYLSKAMNTIERARALTQQLLTFAKGGAPIQKIDQLFPFVEETAKFALSGANVSCHVDVQQDLWACNFDKNQIGQVIDNLIINAQQAMPVGGTIELTARNISLAEKEHPLLVKGNYVKLSVKDTGVGISEEFLGKIFDPFFTTKPKGHGLGLATCYSIIKRHNGCIDVESVQGKGSTFKVFLPASTETASAAIKPTDNKHKGSGTFLVMDDEEVMRDTIGNMLKTLGYSVVCKENGKDAIDFVTIETKANRTIAGMIFDLTVPGAMGGKAAIEEIRKTDTNIPCFVASGYADDPVMKKPTEYGFMASICKPFRKSELSEMLNRYMNQK